MNAMEDVTAPHGAEVGVDATALRELDPNASASTIGPNQTTDQNTDPVHIDETILDANEGAVYDDVENAAQDKDDPNQPVLTAGYAPTKKKKKRKPKSKRGLV